MARIRFHPHQTEPDGWAHLRERCGGTSGGAVDHREPYRDEYAHPWRFPHKGETVRGDPVDWLPVPRKRGKPIDDG